MQPQPVAQPPTPITQSRHAADTPGAVPVQQHRHHTKPGQELTGDEAPEVQPDGAVQGLVRAAKGVEHEETCSHQSKDDQDRAEENDTDMDTHRDNFEQIWKN